MYSFYFDSIYFDSNTLRHNLLRLENEQRTGDMLWYLHVFTLRLEYITTRKNEICYDIFMYSHFDSNTLRQEKRRYIMISSCILIPTQIHYDKSKGDILRYLHVFALRLEYITTREKRYVMISSFILTATPIHCDKRRIVIIAISILNYRGYEQYYDLELLWLDLMGIPRWKLGLKLTRIAWQCPIVARG
jgi:hypothetical protein